MKDTIKSQEGYSVRKVRNIITGEEVMRVDDGATPLFVAIEKSLEEYEDEKAGNELDEDYLTRI